MVLSLQRSMVLIESDWNLKLFSSRSRCCADACINRIRLEFKAESSLLSVM